MTRPEVSHLHGRFAKGSYLLGLLVKSKVLINMTRSEVFIYLTDVPPVEVLG